MIHEIRSFHLIGTEGLERFPNLATSQVRL